MNSKLIPRVSKIFHKAKFRDEIFNQDERQELIKMESKEQAFGGDVKRSCHNNLYFGFFFDGTKNNYVGAESSKTHSNVVRLYD
ncbi:hypothetical protein, partial [Janthinobacterium agaricidamnosum]